MQRKESSLQGRSDRTFFPHFLRQGLEELSNPPILVIAMYPDQIPSSGVPSHSAFPPSLGESSRPRSSASTSAHGSAHASASTGSSSSNSSFSARSAGIRSNPTHSVANAATSSPTYGETASESPPVSRFPPQASVHGYPHRSGSSSTGSARLHSAPKPYRGALSPFPLPVGKRSLGGLAALDEQMRAATLGKYSDSDPRAEPARLGTTRCYWTLLSTRGTPEDPHDLTFLYCDPVLQSHMGSEKDLVVGKSFFDFVHPTERAQAKIDLRDIVASRTVFGSVTRCRYYRVPAIREALGCAKAPRDAEAHLYTSDDLYLPLEVVLNMVGESVALCFFHAVLNKTVNDNNEANKSHWTNWCGTPRELYDVDQCNRLWSLALSHDIQPPKSTTDERKRAPEWIFQVLSMPEDNSFPEIVFSWPPPRLHTEEHAIEDYRDSHEAYDDGSYFADEFARLAQGVRTSPSAKTQSGQTTRNGESGTIQDGANTSCTRRFRAKHTLTTEGMVRSVESVLVPYGTVMLACFNTTYQQTMSRASVSTPRESVSEEPSPVRTVPTGMPFAPTADDGPGYWPEQKRNRGIGSPHREARSGGLPLPADSVITQAGEAHWPPAVTRTHPLPRGDYDPRDGFAEGYSMQQQQRGRRPYQSQAHDVSPRGSSHSKRKPGSEDGGPSEPNRHDEISPTTSPSRRERSSDEGRTATGSAFAAAGSSGAASGEPEGEKRCTSCGTSNSPEWRKGPTGQKTLCNACGLRFSRSVSRQQKKEGKARAEQQQKEQAIQHAVHGQREDDRRSFGDVRREGVMSAGGDGRRPFGHLSDPHRQHQQQHRQYGRDSSDAYRYSYNGSGSYPAYHHYVSEGRSAGAPPDIPHIGYGHHTARKIASMGWGPPPGHATSSAGPGGPPPGKGGMGGPGRADSGGVGEHGPPRGGGPNPNMNARPGADGPPNPTSAYPVVRR